MATQIPFIQFKLNNLYPRFVVLHHCMFYVSLFHFHIFICFGVWFCTLSIIHESSQPTLLLSSSSILYNILLLLLSAYSYPLKYQSFFGIIVVILNYYCHTIFLFSYYLPTPILSIAIICHRYIYTLINFAFLLI